MKKIFLLFLLLMSIVMTGCQDETAVDNGKINVPFDSEDCNKANYQDLINELKNAGFTNIREEPLNDLITGWITEEGEVEKISVGGDEEFISADEYLPDVEIVISYHSFPEKKESVEEETSAYKNEIEGDDVDYKITKKNNDDFKNVLKANNDNQLYIDFANKYKGETVEFNGCITYISNHDDYNTRYDILLSGGDYIDENTVNPGPIFKFEDVNTYDMGINDLFLPDFISVGSNVHIVANIVNYDNESYILFLKPISVESR